MRRFSGRGAVTVTGYGGASLANLGFIGKLKIRSSDFEIRDDLLNMRDSRRTGFVIEGLKNLLLLVKFFDYIV